MNMIHAKREVLEAFSKYFSPAAKKTKSKENLLISKKNETINSGLTFSQFNWKKHGYLLQQNNKNKNTWHTFRIFQIIMYYQEY